jgi:class 3 adenylate cyclase/GAF domain-containing protein
MSDASFPAQSTLSDLSGKARDQVQRMRASLAELNGALAKQAQILRLREIAMPQEVSRDLDRLDNALAAFERILTKENPELAQLRSLSKTYALINSSLDLDTVLGQALDEIIQITGASRGFILLRSPETGRYEFRTLQGFDHALRASIEIGPMGEALDTLMADNAISRSILNTVLESGEPLLTDNATADPRINANLTVMQYNLRAVLCVPLAGAGGAGPIDGLIYVDNRYRPGVFGKRELNLLTAFANQTAVAIENARLFAQVQETLREISRVNELMENVFASISSGVIAIDGEDRIATFNDAAGAILAVPPRAAIGQPAAAVLPDEPALTDAIAASRAERLNASIELRARIPASGQRATLGVRLSPLQVPAAPDLPRLELLDVDDTQDEAAPAQASGVALVIDDLTQQREREQAFDTLRRYLPPGMAENIHQIANVAMGGERREVTCVFLLTCPYGALAPDARPRSMMQMLNIYLETATDIIHQANGVIDKYIGNEIMVMFNTQLNADPDHAVHAVEMALELRRAYTDLYARLGIAPDPHLYTVGVHTGIATLGNVGSYNRRSFTALGDTINLAKRIHDTAAPGQILITGETCDYLLPLMAGNAPRIAAEALPPLVVRGRQSETRLYQIFRPR